MEQYIPKSVLVAEITHKIKVLEVFIKNFDGISDKIEKAKNKIEALGDALLFLDTLEVKEVDLDAELNKWRHNHFHGRRDKEASGEYLERVSQLELAKHFFELGLKAQKEE